MSKAGAFMNPGSVQLYDAAASRAIDAHAIAHMGISGYQLMQRAADAAFDCLVQRYPRASSVTVMCGKGNNAGDAYLVARRAHQIGMRTQVLAAVDPAELSGDAALAHAEARAAGVSVSPADTPISGDVIVDGLLGTGLNGAPRPPFAECIERVNAHPKPVLSIDIPSGISADTGASFAEAVYADVTVSFITRKIGLYTGAGVSHAGRREFADLGVPAEMYVAPGIPLLSWDARRLPALDANTYKHRQGHVVVAGGDDNMPGAVAMACEAALRVGAGMVTALTRAQHTAPIVARTPEVMVLGFDPEAADDAQALLERADLVVLGPGLGRNAWGKALYEMASQTELPTVLDADGLYWLAQAGGWPGGALVMSPHSAEAARLLNCETRQIQQDRPDACRRLRERYGAQGVLKGAGSLIFSDDMLAVCSHGNPGMASAGMGDVLSGILGGLLAQDADPAGIPAALTNAVLLHSAAADVAAAQAGQRSLIATDITAQLPIMLRAAAADEPL